MFGLEKDLKSQLDALKAQGPDGLFCRSGSSVHCGARVYAPANRASRVNPIDSLRYE